jgi:hypothetical protein
MPLCFIYEKLANRPASSIVYRAEDAINGDIVAIKVTGLGCSLSEADVSLGRQVTTATSAGSSNTLLMTTAIGGS